MRHKGYADAYTITGCKTPEHCGTFVRAVFACPNLPSLGGVPYYQLGESGPVLYMMDYGLGDAKWIVSSDCGQLPEPDAGGYVHMGKRCTLLRAPDVRDRTYRQATDSTGV